MSQAEFRREQEREEDEKARAAEEDMFVAVRLQQQESLAARERAQRLQREQEEIAQQLNQEHVTRQQEEAEQKRVWQMFEADRRDRELAERTQMATFDCPVCMEPHSMEDAFEMACGHIVCREGARRYVVEHFRTPPVKCPMPASECGRDMSPDEILDMLTPEEQQQYYTASLKAYEESNPLVKHCMRPNCPGIVELVDENDTHCICPMCQTEWCSACVVPWHVNLTCAQYKERREENDTAEERTIAFIRQMGWPQCPRCHRFVVKNGGCDHIRCLCAADFNYVTGQPM